MTTELTRHYRFELILDLQGCDPNRFNRSSIDLFYTDLCDLIDMEKCEVHFWDDVGVAPEEQQSSPQTKGTSANKNIMKNDLAALPWAPGQLRIVDNYWEAAGIMMAMRAGISPDSVRRPIRRVQTETILTAPQDYEGDEIPSETRTKNLAMAMKCSFSRARM